MTREEALRVAEATVGSECEVTIHEGQQGSVAVRLSGLDLRNADPIGQELESALPGGKYVRDGAFAAVWFDA